MKTVKIRIALAVSKDGEWHAYGSSGVSDEGKRAIVDSHIMPDVSYWIDMDALTPNMHEAITIIESEK